MARLDNYNMVQLPETPEKVTLPAPEASKPPVRLQKQPQMWSVKAVLIFMVIQFACGFLFGYMYGKAAGIPEVANGIQQTTMTK